jgi:hypothetical protein
MSGIMTGLQRALRYSTYAKGVYTFSIETLVTQHISYNIIQYIYIIYIIIQ